MHNKLGRFCREKQYADELEKLLKQANIVYKREYELKNFNDTSPKGNKVDFLIHDLVILDVKAKNHITKEDYYQMLRYIKGANVALGIIVNFRNAHLKPNRVINNQYH